MIHRKNDKGIWKEELWTKRDFAPCEIQFGPCSSQLKDTHLMASAHAIVGLPKHGRGAHPENQALALDGRGRTSMAKKEVIDSEEHQGSFFWLVGRTSEASQANLVFENISFELEVKMNLPAPKRKRVSSSSWEASELPQIPILLNKKAIKEPQEHTKLLVLQAPKNLTKK